MSVTMVVLDGKHAGRQIELPPTQFVIGRDPRCHLRPTSSDVSRFHCAIATYSGHVHVRDLKSQNGTFVNDQRISGAVRLHRGDVLRVGPLRLQVLVQRTPQLLDTVGSGLGWLVRSPDATETAALDPSARTLIGSGEDLDESTGSDTPLRSWRMDPAHEETGAIAGDFLREYLHRRTGANQHRA
jgi:predicted component of type VI protein secretion system